jgi:hypothetical protein
MPWNCVTNNARCLMFALDCRALSDREPERTKEQNQVLRAETESTSRGNEAFKLRAQLQRETNAILQAELRNLWNSWSWRLFRPLRSFVRKWRGFGTETEPLLDADSQVIQTIITIRQSLSGELTTRLRLIHRSFAPHRGSPRLHPSRLRANKPSGLQ